MKRWTSTVLFALCLLLTAVGCGSSGSGNQTPPPTPIPTPSPTPTPTPTPATVGDGTLTFSTATFPAAVAAYVQQLVADITAPGYLYQTCGTASDSSTVEVVYDPNHAGGAFEFVADLKAPKLFITRLPVADVSGVDRQFDLTFAHETGHGLRNRLRFAPFLEPNFLFAEEEGWANACAALVARKFVTTGKRPAFGYAAVEPLMDLDTLHASMPISTIASFPLPLVRVGTVAYTLLASATSRDIPSLAPVATANCAALNKKQAFLTKAEKVVMLNSLGVTVDGQLAGSWFDNLGVMLALPTSKLGIVVSNWVGITPQMPQTIVVSAVSVAQTGTGFIAIPMASGAATIHILDTTGLEVKTIASDLTATSFPGLLVPLNTTLATGAYTVKTDVSIGGTIYHTAPSVFVVVPSNLVGSTGDPVGFPGTYVISVDTAGNAVNGALTVTEGTIGSNAAGQGYLIVTPSATTGDITVNGKKFTGPKPQPGSSLYSKPHR